MLRKWATHLPPQIILPIGIGIAAFLIDLKTPDDISDGFFYILAVVSCAWVPLADSALYVGFALMLPMSLGYFVSPLAVPPWTGIANRALGILVIWLVAFVVWRNAHLIRDRGRALAELEHLHSATELAANAERIELSRWLHDGLAQQLVAVGWSLDRIANRSLDDEAARAEARKLRATIDGALETVHRKAVELRKSESEHSELSVQIQRYVTDFIRRTDLSVDVLGTQYLARVPAPRATLCLQIVQEALTNVAKHATASRALVEIKEEFRAVCITITDDGRGIAPGARDKPDRLGLLGLHECVSAVGGSLDVSNVSPGGVRIEARVPIE